MTCNKVWEVMNDLEMVTSKIVSAREIIDTAAEAIQRNEYDKAETLAMAAYEFLGYYLDEFDAKFKLAWQETVKKQDIGFEVDTTLDDCMPPWGHSDMEYITRYSGGSTAVSSCDKDDPSPECKKSWNDFWEENYYPEEHNQTKEEKEQSREYNLRESEYYNKRAELDAISRNDPTRLKYEGGWIYESPDGGKTVTKRKIGSTEKIIVKEDKVVKWQLPVEIDPGGEYFVMFPDDLLEAANLAEGDTVEWVDNKNGSYTLRKVIQNLMPDEC